MTTPQTIPVLICAYSREKEFCDVLGSVLSAGASRIYINIDGANTPEISETQKAMFAFVELSRTRFPTVEIFIRQPEFNQGAAVSIISSLDWFFSNETFGLIVEDDLQFDSSLFDFVSWGASVYEPNSDIWIISGSNFFSDHEDLQGKIHLANYPVTWGWATWRDKWSLMRPEIISDNKPPSLLVFDPVVNFWKVGAYRARTGMIDAWDIPLAEAMRRMQKFSVVPPVNLVRNIGFSKLASNTKVQNYPLDLPIEKISNFFPLEYLHRRYTIAGEQVNCIYEKKIYGITLRNTLSAFMSKLDFFRFRKYSRENLKDRLDAANKAGYRFF